MIPIQVETTHRLIAKIKRQAKATFPYEAFGYLLGTDAGSVVTVEELFTPEGVREQAGTNYINILPHWILEAQEEAKEDGLTVVGDWHSHPYRYEQGAYLEWGLSESDCREGWLGLCGLVVVVERKGGRLDSRVRFYGPLHRTEVKIA